MLKIKLITLAALVAFVAAPSVVLADAPKASYSAKKRGGYVFKEKTPEKNPTVASDYTDPSNIEPAAGAHEPEAPSQESSIANTIKLPRKN